MNREASKLNFRTRIQKIIGGFLISFLLLAQAPVAHALPIPTAEVVSIPNQLKWAIDFGVVVLETIGYKMLRNVLQKVGEDAAIRTFGEFAGGGPGQEPFFWGQSWDAYIKDVIDSSQGFFIDGLAAGIDTANKEASNKDRYKAKETEVTEENRQLSNDIDELERQRQECEDKATGLAAEESKEVGIYIYPASTEFYKNNCGPIATDIITKSQKYAGNKASLDLLGPLAQQKQAAQTQQKANEQGGYSESTTRIINTLCNHSLSAKLQLMFPFIKPPQAVKPLCTWKDFTTNWSNVVKNTGFEDLITSKNPNGWKVLKGMINPAGSEVAVTFGLYMNYLDLLAEKDRKAILERITGEIKPLKDFAGNTKTPGSLIEEQVKKSLIEGPFENTTSPMVTGNFAADVGNLVGTFLDSFLSKSQDLVWKGISNRAQATNFGSAGGGDPAISYSESAPITSQQEAIKVRQSKLASLKSTTIAQEIKVISELQHNTDCNLHPNYCVINSGFAEAAQAKMTVSEAMEKGKLNPEGAFGFRRGSRISQEDATTQTPSYPYASMVILRKYRILPIGWEIAALYIKDHPEACGGDRDYVCTLKDVIKQFNDPLQPLYRLVDPSWLLKAPAARCVLEGYGQGTILKDARGNDVLEHICRSDTNNDGLVSCEAGTVTLEKKFECARALKVGLEQSETEIHQFAVNGKKFRNEEELQTAINQGAFQLTAENIFQCVRPLDDKGGKNLPIIDKYDYFPSRGKQCLDEQTCLSEDSKGECKEFGYCLEERKKVVFSGTSCPQEFDTCLNLTDVTDRENRPTYSFLKDSIPDVSSEGNLKQCTKDVAGCRGYSSRQYATSTPQNPSWHTEDADKVYLTASARTCPVEQAGCTRLQGGASSAYRLAPREWRCDLADGYKKPECKNYALACNANYVGCAAYTPVPLPGNQADPQVAGTSPIQCNEGCVGITSYIEKQSTIEEFLQTPSTPAFLNFVASSANQCNAQDAGCEEFTDLQKGESGEKRVAYSKIIDCKVRPETPDTNQTFYSWFGSDQQGSRLVKYEFEHDGSSDPKPLCAFGLGAASCSCTFNTADDTKNHDERKGDCREFINSKGTSGTYWTNLLVYVRDANDCKNFRRTTTGKTLVFSPSLSRSCPATAVQCHEYRSPYAANQEVIISDTFDTQDNTEWHDGDQNSPLAQVSKDTETFIETFNQGSLRSSGGVLVRRVQKSLPDNATATIEFVIKTDADAIVSAGFMDDERVSVGSTQPANGSASFTQVRAGVWTPIKVYALTNANRPWLLISASTSAFTIDRILVKRTDGIVHVIKKTWTTSGGQCKNSDNTIQYSCQQYRGPEGLRNYQGFTQLCPMQLVGCKEFTDANQKTLLIDDHFDTPLASPITDPPTSGWIWQSPGTVQEYRVTDGSLIVDGPDNSSVSSDQYIKRETTLRANSDHTLSFRFKDLAQTTLAFTGVKVQVIAGTNFTTELFKGEKTYVSKDDNYKTWESFSFSLPSVEVDTNIYLRIMPVGGSHSGKYAIDDVVLTENSNQQKLYLVDDAQKSCSEQFNGCTAYGLPTLNTAGNVQSWSTLAYMVSSTPALAQDSRVNGVCKEQNINCRTYEYRYNDGKTAKTQTLYFQDPQGRLCEPVKEGDTYKFKRKVQSDCVGSNCATEPCPASAYKKTLTDPNTKFWVKTCPQEAHSCRKITDPECGEYMPSFKTCTTNADCPAGSLLTGTCGTIPAYGSQKVCILKDMQALRDNYGRGIPGLSCRADYYFLADVSEGDCGGKVDVDKGCLLFNDSGKGTNLSYSSGAYYMTYASRRSAIALNEQEPSADISPADYSRRYGSAPMNDANTVLKVSADRECRIALKPITKVVDESDTYTIRVAPFELAASSTRDRLLWSSSSTNALKNIPQLKGTFLAPGRSPTAPDVAFMSLSGLSRPNFYFDGRTYSPSGGGHDGYFDWTQSVGTESGVNSKLSVTAMAIGYSANLVPLVSSCRMVARADSPVKRQYRFGDEKIGDADVISCSYSDTTADSATGYDGLYGFCLEPNPKFDYHGGQGASATTLAEYRRNYTPASGNDANGFPFNWGYRNYCLNWYPVERTASDVTAPENDSPPLHINAYHCIATTTPQTIEQTNLPCKDLDEEGYSIGEAEEPPTHCFRKSELNDKTIPVRDSSGGASEYQSLPGPLEKALFGPLAALSSGRLVPFSLFSGDLSANKDYYQDDVAREGAFRTTWGVEVESTDEEKKIREHDIESITYTVNYATRASSPGVDFNYNGNYNQLTSARRFGPKYTYMLRDQRAIQNDIGEHNVFEFSKCHGSGANFIGIQPVFNYGRLDKWRWRYCDNGYSGVNEVAFVSVVVTLRKYDPPRQPTATFVRKSFKTGVLCSAIVRMTQETNGRTDGVLATTKSINPAFAKKPDEQCRGFYCAQELDTTTTVYDEVSDPAWTSSKKFNPADTDLFRQCGGWKTINACRMETKSSVAIETIDTITTNYYAKPYEYWKWDNTAKRYVKGAWVVPCSERQPAGFSRIESYTDNHGLTCYTDKIGSNLIQFIKDPWERARDLALPPIIRPAEGGAQHRFTFVDDSKGTLGSQTGVSENTQYMVTVKFQVSQTEKQQLPLRYIAIDWGDGRGISPILPLQPDGHGSSNMKNGAPRVFSQSNILQSNIFERAPINKTICVMVMDNYEAKTKVCGYITRTDSGLYLNFDNDSEQHDPRGFGVPQSFWDSFPSPLPETR